MKSSFRLNQMLTVLAVLAGTTLFAQNAPAAEEKSLATELFGNGVFVVMLCTQVLLLFVIIGMTEVVKAGAWNQRKKNSNIKGAATVLFLLTGTYLFAQDATAAAMPEAPFTYWGMGAIPFFIMLTVIIVELIIIYVLYRTGMMLLGRPEQVEARKLAKKNEPSFMEKFNASVAVEEEAAILMDHDYDGIQELDNNLPPWWKYGFYVTIVWSVIYLTHYHILHTGKLQAEEYAQQIDEGNRQVAEYKKSAKDLVDENNVVLLTEAADISAGAVLYKENCAVCHGAKGEGTVGPNLTDKYWLHKGGPNDVFRSIKYGWPDKGMKAWGDELSASKMLQLASFIATMPEVQGKEPQGDLYTPEGAPAPDSAKSDSAKQPSGDSAAPVADTAKSK